jgi:hypothetical protein
LICSSLLPCSLSSSAFVCVCMHLIRPKPLCRSRRTRTTRCG